MKKLSLGFVSLLISLNVFAATPATSAPKNINVVRELFNFTYDSMTQECLPTNEKTKNMYLYSYEEDELVFEINKQGKFGMLSSFSWIVNYSPVVEKKSAVTFTTIGACLEFKMMILQKMESQK